MYLQNVAAGMNGVMVHVIHTYILGYYELPVSCLVEPSADRCLRPPDRTFIDSLKQEMVQNPT